MKKDDEQLRDLARSATPGPWAVTDSSPGSAYWTLSSASGETICRVSVDGEGVPADLAYLEAVAPDTVLSLLERIERLEANRYASPLRELLGRVLRLFTETMRNDLPPGQSAPKQPQRHDTDRAKD